jgi:hypothetical protein
LAFHLTLIRLQLLEDDDEKACKDEHVLKSLGKSKIGTLLCRRVNRLAVRAEIRRIKNYKLDNGNYASGFGDAQSRSFSEKYAVVACILVLLISKNRAKKATLSSNVGVGAVEKRITANSVSFTYIDLKNNPPFMAFEFNYRSISGL